MTHESPVEALATLRHEFGEHGGVNMSIEASSTFTVVDSSTMPDIFAGRKGPEEGGCYLYGRHFNPTVYNLGRQLAALEGVEAAYCSASGMGAISAVIMALCNAGDHVVASNTIYGGTWALLHDFMPLKTGVTTSFVDSTRLQAVREAISERTRLIYVESMSNPTLRVADIPALAALAHEAGLPLVVDNTFAPLLISPAPLGADIVVHSMTKFIGGASDLIGGAVCASSEFIGSLMDLHTGPLMILGPTLDPRIAADISLRLPHLPLRMKAHSERCLALAERTAALGVPVMYPGLAAHPDHALLGRLHNPEFGYGGLLTIDAGSEARAMALMNTLQNEHQFGYVAVSLGYFDTLMSCSASSTSSEMPDEALAAAAISPGLVRMAVGYSGSLEQRWGQLEAALKATGLA
ncbi:aminotransferase class I/II-fold pyridoxal phosphate-dependent enzyme [Seongchinamella sediminis]|uniref:Aminotransferase class I/II-fold pyridoxal phosphate-dependent enzyme n=1 Tax=Seongchinamella sediminis TaxID=2283635 RepID=A0A3L7DZ86_9GAMM|nr:aminotransferase class I/II-fold pyridoxal phosphate-dependent enzyme [Seongchinamella sediminis]RLQ22907.1 aminotransferase class I/II-fold pyridoxal phosphate-dependent enzyme [Seongchinamella sediminis]